MKIRVLVRLKDGVLDVQGKAVERGLSSLGYETMSDVKIGRLIELEVDRTDFESAKKQVEEICDKLLANPIIEKYEILEAA